MIDIMSDAKIESQIVLGLNSIDDAIEYSCVFDGWNVIIKYRSQPDDHTELDRAFAFRNTHIFMHFKEGVGFNRPDKMVGLISRISLKRGILQELFERSTVPDEVFVYFIDIIGGASALIICSHAVYEISPSKIEYINLID